MRKAVANGFASLVSAAAIAFVAAVTPAWAVDEPPHSAELDAMIIRAAKRHGVPERLVRRVVMRESRYNPRARNHAFWGLMQISYPTARSMGFTGTPEQLLNPVVNLTYAVPYLANAFVAAGKREDAAVRLYASGYYDTARQRGLLGLMRTADSLPVIGFRDDGPSVVAAAVTPPSTEGSFFGALFGSPAQAAESAPPQASGPSPDASTTTVATVAPATAGVKKARGDGVTVLARGEQGVEQLAAYSGRSVARETHKRGHKSTVFASLDVPASARAYMGTDAADGSAPQAAIAGALAAAPSSTSPDDGVARQAEASSDKHVVPSAGKSVATTKQASRATQTKSASKAIIGGPSMKAKTKAVSAGAKTTKQAALPSDQPGKSHDQPAGAVAQLR